MFSCKNGSNNKLVEKATVPVVKAPSFNADSAYNFVKTQVEFGSRVPNSIAHKSCGKYLVAKLKEYGATTIEQDAILTTYDGTKLESKNIIGQYQPNNPNRILLCAHWDSRHIADQDPDPLMQMKPILGANDGASGVGVLLEIARQLQKENTTLGIDIIFFDAEDYGQPENSKHPRKDNSWCLGSQYWGKNLHKKNYYARFGILLDMVGASEAQFYREYHSVKYAKHIVNKVWNAGAKLGFSNHFIPHTAGAVMDDHYFVNIFANIPCIDIIQRDPSQDKEFGSYWHTQSDDMSNIDKKTLKSVGQTVLEVIYQER